MAKRNNLKKHLKRAFREQDVALVQDLLHKAMEDLGEAETKKLISDKILDKLSWEDYNWWLNQLPSETKQLLHQKPKDSMFAVLTQGGFELGKDFSVGSDGGVMVSDEANEYLLSQMPEDIVNYPLLIADAM